MARHHTNYRPRSMPVLAARVAVACALFAGVAVTAGCRKNTPPVAATAAPAAVEPALASKPEPSAEPATAPPKTYDFKKYLPFIDGLAPMAALTAVNKRYYELNLAWAQVLLDNVAAPEEGVNRGQAFVDAHREELSTCAAKFRDLINGPDIPDDFLTTLDSSTADLRSQAGALEAQFRSAYEPFKERISMQHKNIVLPDP